MLLLASCVKVATRNKHVKHIGLRVDTTTDRGNVAPMGGQNLTTSSKHALTFRYKVCFRSQKTCKYYPNVLVLLQYINVTIEITYKLVIP